MDILNKIKNKKDFTSIILQTNTAQIFVQLNKVYFESQNKYNIIIDYYNGTRETKREQTKKQILDIFKNFKIIKAEQ